MLRERQFQSEIDALQRLKIDRELDRQKFVEHKKLQQHLYVFYYCLFVFFSLKTDYFVVKTRKSYA